MGNPTRPVWHCWMAILIFVIVIVGAQGGVWALILVDVGRVVHGAGVSAARRGAVRAGCSATATTWACAAARWRGSGARPTSRPPGYSPPVSSPSWP